jgi:cellulose synthase/poly-beta-1,6-N-acetylglucosamine synthase-like glycosyltransferase
LHCALCNAERKTESITRVHQGKARPKIFTLRGGRGGEGEGRGPHSQRPRYLRFVSLPHHSLYRKSFVSSRLGTKEEKPRLGYVACLFFFFFFSFFLFKIYYSFVLLYIYIIIYIIYFVLLYIYIIIYIIYFVLLYIYIIIYIIYFFQIYHNFINSFSSRHQRGGGRHTQI